MPHQQYFSLRLSFELDNIELIFARLKSNEKNQLNYVFLTDGASVFPNAMS